MPSIALAPYPTPIQDASRLRTALGGGPRLLVKRDDAIAFGFGGNKVRKLEMVAARAQAEGADLLVTTGGVQSNHCRVTAAAAARLGMRCLIVANGVAPERLSGNALLDSMYGAEVRYVASREDRVPAMEESAAAWRAIGGRPFVIPLGASTPLGALGYARAVGEMIAQLQAPPDYIFHSTSSGGTQAGLLAGCKLHGIKTRVVGISADETADGTPPDSRRDPRRDRRDARTDGARFAASCAVEADDRFVGDGYGVASDASREAQTLLARTEALVVDHTYTAKALAGMIAWIREERIEADATVLFWHTGGQVGIFAL